MSFAEEVAAFRAAHPAVEAVEVLVTDLSGIARGKRVPMEGLEKLGTGAMKMPVSTLGLDVFGSDVPENAIAIECGDPDGPMVPVEGSLAPMLWTPRPMGQVLCSIAEPDGSPCAYDPRSVLARVAGEAERRGYTACVALELEFYLIDAEEAAPPRNPLAGGRLSRDQIYDMGVMQAFDGIIGEIVEAARALGAPADTAICEFGAGQFEMNLGHVPDPLAAADHMVALKRAIRGVARANGMDASFMPKPYGEAAGSGQHIHLSLLDASGASLFAGKGPEPNAALRHAVAGLLGTMAESMLIWAPSANAYRRFLPGSYAPVVAAWGLDNRGVALRVPATEGQAARLEHRVAGADANPYLLTAAVLAGALAGIEAGDEPPEPVPVEACEAHGPRLPLTWDEAIRAFDASAFAGRWLGPELRRILAGMKRQEMATLLARVPDTEYDAYLRTL